MCYNIKYTIHLPERRVITMKFIQQYLVPCITALCLTGLLSGCSQQQTESETEIETTGIYSIAQLNGKRIGTQIGTTAVLYAEDIPDAQVQSFTKGSAALKALKENKIDAVIIDSEPAKILTADSDAYRILYDSFVEEEYSIAYSKSNPQLGEQLNTILNQLKKDGTIDEITSHWIGENADQISYKPERGLSKEGTLVMATNAEFPPYESKDSNGNIVGIDVDIMTAVCNELNVNLEIKDMQFDSVLASVENGKADVGVAGISVTPEREKEVDFTQSYATTKLVVIVRNE